MAKDYFKYVLKVPNCNLFLSVKCSFDVIDNFDAELVLTPNLEEAFVFESLFDSFSASGFIRRNFGIYLGVEHLLEIFGDKVVVE